MKLRFNILSGSKSVLSLNMFRRSIPLIQYDTRHLAHLFWLDVACSLILTNNSKRNAYFQPHPSLPCQRVLNILQISKVLEGCFDIERGIKFEWSELKANGRYKSFLLLSYPKVFYEIPIPFSVDFPAAT